MTDGDIERHRAAAQRDLRGRSFIGATVLALLDRLESAERERDTLTALARAVATGYAGSVMVGGDCGAVTLHYTTSAQAEAAHAALTDYIDALAAKEQSND